MRKLVAPLVSLLMFAGGVFLVIQGGAAPIILGTLLIIASVLFYVLWVKVLQDPQGAVEKLMLRRQELELKTGRATSSELPAEELTAPQSDSIPAPSPTPLNRAARRAAQKK